VAILTFGIVAEGAGAPSYRVLCDRVGILTLSFKAAGTHVEERRFSAASSAKKSEGLPPAVLAARGHCADLKYAKFFTLTTRESLP